MHYSLAKSTETDSLFSFIHSSCQNPAIPLLDIQPQRKRSNAYHQEDPKSGACSIKTHCFVTVVPYHAITNRLDAFLSHQNEIMRENESIELVISTQKSDQSYVQKALDRLMSKSAATRTFVVSLKFQNIGQGVENFACV